MFFYLINNSSFFNKSVNNQDKYIKLLIYGTVAYVVLHAILFVGGEDALFYNFRYYFWTFLALDICVLFATNITNENSPIQKIFSSEKDEIKNEYRVDIQSASINDIMDGVEPEKPVKQNEPPPKREKRKKKRERVREQVPEKKVSFDLSGGTSDFNKFAQPINNPNEINTNSILKNSNQNKSTPLDSLLRERTNNPNDFISGMDDGDGYQSFSDSESEYNSDLDMDMFERGLTM